MVLCATVLGIWFGVRHGSLEKQCERGDGTACGVLGDRTFHAATSEKDFELACGYYRKSCQGQVTEACTNLGALLGRRKCRGDQGEALGVLQKACDLGNMRGCNNLAMIFRDGKDGVEKDIPRAMDLFRKACAKVAVACDNLGSQLWDADKKAALAVFQTGCDLGAGDPDRAACCRKVGIAYQYGFDVPIDLARARSMYTLACAGQEPDTDACYSLGLAELHGNTAAEIASAATHFAQACGKNHPGACNNLGLMYSTGTGVKKDLARAIPFMEKACNGGELVACANLGSRLVLGEGAPVDLARGHALITKACKGGVADACRGVVAP